MKFVVIKFRLSLHNNLLDVLTVLKTQMKSFPFCDQCALSPASELR